MHICIYVYMYTCMDVYMYTCIDVYMYTCIHVYMYICIYVYMYICIYVYMYICIYVYMYMTQREKREGEFRGRDLEIRARIATGIGFMSQLVRQRKTMLRYAKQMTAKLIEFQTDHLATL